MAPNPRRVDARLQALYDQLPRLECRGICSDSCGPIEVTVRERERIEKAAGKRLTCGAGATCSMLTHDRRCSVYELRPLICRMWGVMKSLRCPYGCVPEGGHLPDTEGYRLIAEALAIGGDPGGRERFYRETFERLLEELGPEGLEAYAADITRSVVARPSVDGRWEAGIPKTVIER